MLKNDFYKVIESGKRVMGENLHDLFCYTGSQTLCKKSFPGCAKRPFVLGNTKNEKEIDENRSRTTRRKKRRNVKS